MLARSPITIWCRRLVRENSVFHPMTPISRSEPQIPRPSASLIIVNARNEVLLVHRNPQARHFGGVHVRSESSIHRLGILLKGKPRFSRGVTLTGNRMSRWLSPRFGRRSRSQAFSLHLLLLRHHHLWPAQRLKKPGTIFTRRN